MSEQNFTKYHKLRTPAGAGARFLLDVEVAEIYGLKLSTLRNWRIRGKGPPWRKICRCARYKVADVEMWLDSRPMGGEGGLPSSALKP